MTALRRSRKNEHHTTDPEGPDMSDPIPLSALVLEGLGGNLHGPPNVETLQQRICDAGYPVIVDWIGRKCVSRDVARILLAEHHEAIEAARQAAEETRLENIRRGDPPHIRRVRAIQAAQTASRANGQLDGVSAHAVLTADHFDERMARSSERLDDYLNSDATAYRKTPKPGG
jgi:hypothetical protein